MNDQKYPYGIGPVGRWLIFFGIPFCVTAVLFTATADSLERVIGEKALPYVLFGVPAAIGIGSMILYNHLAKRFINPLGIVGWIIGLSLLYWFFWFGRGAL